MIIALAGYAGAGKSTIARELVARHEFDLIKFADPLKIMLRAIGLSNDEIEGDLKERPCALLGGRTPRHAMQTLGTGWGREMIDPDLWVRLWSVRVGGPQHRVVADDCRFYNEAAAVWAMGGAVIFLSRPGVARRFEHVSESMTFEPDRIIYNSGDPADVAEAVLITAQSVIEDRIQKANAA